MKTYQQKQSQLPPLPWMVQLSLQHSDVSRRPDGRRVGSDGLSKRCDRKGSEFVQFGGHNNHPSPELYISLNRCDDRLQSVHETCWSVVSHTHISVYVGWSSRMLWTDQFARRLCLLKLCRNSLHENNQVSLLYAISKKSLRIILTSEKWYQCIRIKLTLYKQPCVLYVMDGLAPFFRCDLG